MEGLNIFVQFNFKKKNINKVKIIIPKNSNFLNNSFTINFVMGRRLADETASPVLPILNGERSLNQIKY
jgi:hypothetical protein